MIPRYRETEVPRLELPTQTKVSWVEVLQVAAGGQPADCPRQYHLVGYYSHFPQDHLLSVETIPVFCGSPDPHTLQDEKPSGALPER